MSDLDLNEAERTVMEAVARLGPTTSVAVARDLGLSRNMSLKLLERLVYRGLLERSGSGASARVRIKGSPDVFGAPLEKPTSDRVTEGRVALTEELLEIERAMEEATDRRAVILAALADP